MAYGDYYHAPTFSGGLTNNGLPHTIVRSGPITLNGPTRWLDTLIAGGKVRHANNPLLTWSASNAVTERDSNDNIKISRDKSHAKIDPMAGLVNAIIGLIDHKIGKLEETKTITPEMARLIW